ncbi:MAG TPA: HAMP domain-containing protein, partial [Alphaproteobacteria bacterium]|nr:HAMP domain-containing protein [Alphaproteobacteria bacterium]
MRLGDLRIATKIFGVVALLGAVAAVIAATGSFGLQTLGSTGAAIGRTAEESRIGAGISRNALELNRAEYLLAADPSMLDDVAAAVGEVSAALEAGLAEAEQGADPEQQELLAAVRTAYLDYLSAIDDTLWIAERHQDVELSNGQRSVLSAVERSRDIARQLSERVASYVDYTEAKGAGISGRAAGTAVGVQLALIGVAAIGILAGLGLGFVVSRHGVVKPLRSVVDCLHRLADGDLTVEVFGAGRRDEVGDIARALQVFKDNALERRRLAAEQEDEREAKERRAEAVAGMIRRFDAEVAAALEAVTAS